VLTRSSLAISALPLVDPRSSLPSLSSAGSYSSFIRYFPPSSDCTATRTTYVSRRGSVRWTSVSRYFPSLSTWVCTYRRLFGSGRSTVVVMSSGPSVKVRPASVTRISRLRTLGVDRSG
jgi:hypothetical protein